jgi:hypothetical protein
VGGTAKIPGNRRRIGGAVGIGALSKGRKPLRPKNDFRLGSADSKQVKVEHRSERPAVAGEEAKCMKRAFLGCERLAW